MSDFIERLENIVRQRIAGNAIDSYTAELARAGCRRIAQKVGEEGLEVALAAVDGNRAELVEEAADLLYHLLVLLAVSNATLADVSDVLEKRHSG